MAIAAALALGTTGVQAAQRDLREALGLASVDELGVAIADQDWRIRSAACLVLGVRGEEAGYELVLTALACDPDPRVRRAAAEAIERQVVSHLRKPWILEPLEHACGLGARLLLEMRDAAIAQEQMRIRLQHELLGGDRSLLETALEDPDEGVRASALVLAWKLGSSARPVLDQVEHLRCDAAGPIGAWAQLVSTQLHSAPGDWLLLLGRSEAARSLEVQGLPAEAVAKWLDSVRRPNRANWNLWVASENASNHGTRDPVIEASLGLARLYAEYGHAGASDEASALACVLLAEEEHVQEEVADYTQWLALSLQGVAAASAEPAWADWCRTELTSIGPATAAAIADELLDPSRSYRDAVGGDAELADILATMGAQGAAWLAVGLESEAYECRAACADALTRVEDGATIAAPIIVGEWRCRSLAREVEQPDGFWLRCAEDGWKRVGDDLRRCTGPAALAAGGQEAFEWWRNASTDEDPEVRLRGIEVLAESRDGELRQMALLQALDDVDGRVAIVAASAILESSKAASWMRDAATRAMDRWRSAR